MGHEVNFVILTLNEAHNLAGAIESVMSVGDVLVLDSGSTDGTVELARSYGVRVLHHDWAGFGAQRNAAMQHIPASDWVFFLDADERVDDELREFLVSFDPTVDAYYVRRINFFLGRRLTRAGRYPDRQLRLVRAGTAVFEDRAVHERILFDGPIGELPGHLLHRSADPMERVIAKHVDYARLEAEAVAGSPVDKRWLFSTDPQRRRRWFKEKIWLALPGRGTLRILWLLLIKRGILDGSAGVAYARMLAAYECHIDCFRAEARSSSSSQGG